MQVTLIVCDRCGRELPEDDAEDQMLDVKLRYHDPESGWRPIRKRASVELCPACREAFADWLGERGDAIEGLRLDGQTEEDLLGTLRMRAVEPPSA